MQLPAPPRQPGTVGRPRKHGGELALADPATWPVPQITTSTATTRYGTAIAAAWDRVHPRLTHRSAWLDHDGDLPVIEGTLIRLAVDHLPGDRDPKPVWLWYSRTGAAPGEVDRCWQAFLRRWARGAASDGAPADDRVGGRRCGTISSELVWWKRMRIVPCDPRRLPSTADRFLVSAAPLRLVMICPLRAQVVSARPAFAEPPGRLAVECDCRKNLGCHIA